MIHNVLTLFRTFFEIVLLRKGPEDIPGSPLLFAVVSAVWLLLGVGAILAVESYSGVSLFLDLILTIVGLSIYSFVINASGYRERLLTALTTILGCGVIFGVALFTNRIVSPAFLGEFEINVVSTLILLWSLPVKGHIIARTIERQWVVGFLLAVAVFIVQIQLIAVLKPVFDPVT